MMNFNDPILYFNRHTGQVEQEKVLGEKAIQRVYGTSVGKLALHALIKRAFFSKLYGRQMDTPKSCEKIAGFIEQYEINMEESQRSLGEFSSFNDFFYRQLKPEARPIAQAGDNSVAVFPVDGRHMGFSCARDIEQVFVKGQRFDIAALLGNAELGKRYEKGTVVLSRLCPVDYHRFHFPVAGVPSETRCLDGVLGSVSPYALRHKLSWLWTNKRTITLVQTEEWGQVVLIDVGATCVGSIFQTFIPGSLVAKGAEKGYFSFGGSTVMTLFEPHKIQLAEDLLYNTAQGRELFAQMGSIMGTLISF